jgi:uncharacterized protein YkwD
MKIRRRFLWIAGLLALMAALASVWGGLAYGGRNPLASAAREYQQLKAVEQAIFRLTNEARRQNGLPPLERDRDLFRVAWFTSVDMLHRQFFSHVNPDGATPKDRVQARYTAEVLMVGENIWSGTGSGHLEATPLPRLIVDSWMSSPSHRKNILEPSYTHLGVGVAATGKDVRATQVFVRLKQ